jgi:hypothetical protein
MTKQSRTRRTQEAASIAGDLMLAPLVAIMRLPLMAADAGGSRPWSSETTRAMTEKAAAIAEGALAAQLSMLQSAMRFWPEVMSGHMPSILTGAAAEQSVNAALRPASQRVRANFRRLSAKA